MCFLIWAARRARGRARRRRRAAARLQRRRARRGRRAGHGPARQVRLRCVVACAAVGRLCILWATPGVMRRMFSASSRLLSKTEDLPCVAHGSAPGSLQAGDACACTVAHLLPRHQRAADAATRAHRIGPCAHRRSCAAGGALGARAPTARAGGGSSWGGSPIGRERGAQVRWPCCQQSSRLVTMRLLAALVRPAPAAGGEQGAAEAHALQLLLTWTFNIRTSLTAPHTTARL